MKKYNATAGFTFFGIVGFTLVVIILMATKCAKAQSVSVFVGASSANNMIYGAEFKSETFGLFVERYVSNREYSTLLAPTPIAVISNMYDIVYDGLMFGTNIHVKGMSNVLFSVGVGLLEKRTIYYVDYPYGNTYNPYGNTYNPSGSVVNIADTDRVIVGGKQLFAFEVSCGKDFEINDNMIIGIKGGINNRTDIFGTISLGCKF
jgi:hypothetical protein